MAVACLTQGVVDALRASPPSRPVKYFDAELKGFFLEVRALGGASFGVRYRARGRARQMVLADAARTTVNDARAAAWQVLDLVRSGRDPVWERRRGTGNMSLARFVEEHYLPHVRMRKRSWRTDEAILRRHLLPVLGGVSLARVGSADIRTLQHEFARCGAAAGTINRRLAVLSSVLSCAADWGQLPSGDNPARKVAPLPDPTCCERYLTPQQVARLLDELDREANRPVAALCRLLLLTGARRSEITLARWEDVDLDAGLLRVALSKSGKPRHIVLSHLAVECIQALPRRPGCPWLLPAPRTGRPLTGVFPVWERIRNRAGLPELRLHDLRHSYASLLVNAGRSLYEVQHLLGHASPKTTQRYAHLSQGTLREAANSIGIALEITPRRQAPR